MIESSEVATFTETISVASDAPGGVYTCQDWALIDGEPMTDESGEIIYEVKTILVPENFVTGGGHITNGEKGKNRATIVNFGGNAGYMADGSLVGHWNFNFRDPDVKIQTTEITALQFYDFGLEPAPPRPRWSRRLGSASTTAPGRRTARSTPCSRTTVSRRTTRC